MEKGGINERFCYEGFNVRDGLTRGKKGMREWE